MQPHLTFVQISDTHLGPARDWEFYGQNPRRHLEQLVCLIKTFPQAPDFVVHTGDVSSDKSAASYDLAREILAGLSVPLYVVCGNHDDRDLLRDYFGAPPAPSGDPGGPLDYRFEVKGERFIVLDGHSAAVRDPLGQLSAEQLEWVRAEAQPDGPPLTVFVHYPPFTIGSPWYDENMPLVNGAALHAALLPARDRLRGVFFGHAHRSFHVQRGGITYTCAGSSVSGYAWRPWDAMPAVDPDAPPQYNVVQYFADQVVVHRYAFARP